MEAVSGTVSGPGVGVCAGASEPEQQLAPSRGVDIAFRACDGSVTVVSFRNKFLGFRFRKADLVVTEVMARSDSEKFGIRPGMEIINVAGHSVAGMSFEEIQALILQGIGATHEDAKSLEREGVGNSLPGSFGVALLDTDGSLATYQFTTQLLGFRFSDAMPTVTGVVPGSQAAEFGIKEGMVIVAVGGRSVVGMTCKEIREHVKNGVAQLPEEAVRIEPVVVTRV